MNDIQEYEIGQGQGAAPELNEAMQRTLKPYYLDGIEGPQTAIQSRLFVPIEDLVNVGEAAIELELARLRFELVALWRNVQAGVREAK